MSNTELPALIERALDLHRQKDRIDEDLSELKQEVASTGYDKAAFDAVVKRLRLDDDKLKKAKAKEEAMRLYAESIGQQSLF